MLVHHAYYFEHEVDRPTQLELAKGAQIVSASFVSPVTIATAFTVRLVALEEHTAKTETRHFSVYDAWFPEHMRTLHLPQEEGYEKWERVFLAEIRRAPGEQSPWMPMGQRNPLRTAFVYELKKKKGRVRPPAKKPAAAKPAGAAILSDVAIVKAPRRRQPKKREKFDA